MIRDAQRKLGLDGARGDDGRPDPVDLLANTLGDGAYGVLRRAVDGAPHGDLVAGDGG